MINSALIRAESQIGVVQHLTNLGDFKQAKELLTAYYDPISELAGNDRNYFEARRHEKFAWIADYQCGFKETIKEIDQARTYLALIDKSEWEESHEELHSTLNHFEGRSCFGLASQGINRETNLERATEYLNIDLQRYLTLRTRGNSRPTGEAHYHRWLAHCEMLHENWNSANRHIEEVRNLFDEASGEDINSGGTAHYDFLKGVFHYKYGRGGRTHLNQSEFYFSDAARIWEGPAYYPTGAANSHLGLAKTYLRMYRPVEAAKHFKVALDTQPAAVFRGLFVG